MHIAQTISDTKTVHVTQLGGKIDDESLKDELETCKHFLGDSEFDNRRQLVFNFAMNLMDAHTLSQKLDTLFEKPKFAAKLNVASGFVLKIVKDGVCREYYAHEIKTLKERSEFYATEEDMIKIKIVLSITDVVEACIKELASSMWKFYKLTIAALLSHGV